MENLMFSQEHKDLVEQDKEYQYIGSFKTKSYHVVLKVKHLYCNKIYKIRLDSWNTNHRPCGLRTKGCCGNYENSFAYHIEIELGLNLDDVWNWRQNNELGTIIITYLVEVKKLRV